MKKLLVLILAVMVVFSFGIFVLNGINDLKTDTNTTVEEQIQASGPNDPKIPWPPPDDGS